MKRYWLSWYGTSDSFELTSPWWISGERVFADGSAELTICAAIIASGTDAAKSVVVNAHDISPTRLAWRFVEERPDDWEPFCDRFPRAEWMQWPDR